MVYSPKLHLYELMCIKYDISSVAMPFLKINMHQITKEDERLMDCMLDIDEVLTELRFNPSWFKRTLKIYPFQGLTPKEYIKEHKRPGVVEIRIYLTALRRHILDILPEGTDA